MLAEGAQKIHLACPLHMPSQLRGSLKISMYILVKVSRACAMVLYTAIPLWWVLVAASLYVKYCPSSNRCMAAFAEGSSSGFRKSMDAFGHSRRIEPIVSGEKDPEYKWNIILHQINMCTVVSRVITCCKQDFSGAVTSQKCSQSRALAIVGKLTQS